MSDHVITESGGSILLMLADPGDSTGLVVLSEAALKRFSGVYALYQALRQVFGDRLSAAVLDGAVVRIDVQPDEHDGIRYDLHSFVDDAEATAGDLHRNANLARPLPFAAAVKRPALVGVLQAASRAHHAYGLDVVMTIAGTVRPLPIPPPADFTQPDQDRELRRPGSFVVKGLVRDDRRGHQLLVTDNELRVLLPIEESRWAWQAIRHILDDQATLVGTLLRESKVHAWTVDAATRLEVQQDMLEVS